MHENELYIKPHPRYFTADLSSENDSIQCTLCPHRCIIKNNSTGICLVRTNRNGTPEIPYYGRLSALAVDPVEKKPLYHFFPGSKILSAGFFGCNLKCPFCQNYSISTHADLSYEIYPPSAVPAILLKTGGIGLAYTYSEPLIHIEWITETSRILREKGYKNVLVTNGFINEGPADDILEYTDAANIDLKSFNPDFYRKELKGGLDEVKLFIKKASSSIHVEITTLVIPGKNDSAEEISEMASFISSLDRNIPYHLSCYYPSYKYSTPPTPAPTVLELVETAKKYLNYVYPGNVGYKNSDTMCPSCGELLVKRSGYRVSIENIDNKKCIKCGFKINIRL